MSQCQGGSLESKTLTFIFENVGGATVYNVNNNKGKNKGKYYCLSNVQPFLIDMHCLLIGNNLLYF